MSGYKRDDIMYPMALWEENKENIKVWNNFNTTLHLISFKATFPAPGPRL